MRIHAVLDQLSELEERVGRLYTHFYGKFSDVSAVAGIWWEMALEEHEHAGALKMVKELADPRGRVADIRNRLRPLQAMIKKCERSGGRRHHSERGPGHGGSPGTVGAGQVRARDGAGHWRESAAHPALGLRPTRGTPRAPHADRAEVRRRRGLARGVGPEARGPGARAGGARADPGSDRSCSGRAEEKGKRHGTGLEG